MDYGRRAFLNLCGGLAAMGLLPRRLFAQAGGTAQPAPARKTWFLRLIPPRPAFYKDAAPAELKLMHEHYLYWKSLFDKGVCIFGGPVLDPKGAYGVLVVEAGAEDEARALGENDPSVKAGVNRIELAEIRVAFLRPA